MQCCITPRIRDKGQAKAELRGSCHGKGRNIKADGELHLLQLPVGHQGWSEQLLLGEAVPPRRVIPQPLLIQPPEWSLASQGSGKSRITDLDLPHGELPALPVHRACPTLWG